MRNIQPIQFAPQLFIPAGVKDISFYKNAFEANELRRFDNEDGSIHVAELNIQGALFHIHEEKSMALELSPQTAKGTTVLIGIFVPNVDTCLSKAMAAGAQLVQPAQSYDYGYRQAEIKDPFGHIWLIQQEI
jgi:PhnB protein